MQKTKNLSPEAIAARRAYQKKWRDAHPELVRERNRRYWERRAARIKEEMKEHEHEQTADN